MERKDAEREKKLKGYQVLLRKRNPTKLKSEKYHDVKWQKGLSLYTLLLPLHDSDVDNEATRENALFNFLILFEVLSLFPIMLVQSKSRKFELS